MTAIGQLQLAHWLIIAGSALIVLGLLGMVITGPREDPETPAPDEAPSPDGQVQMPWHQSRNTEAENQSDKS